jgi:hypothetical protein
VADNTGGPGQEGIVSTLHVESNVWTPMVGANRGRMERLRDQAQEIVNATGRTIRFVKFSRHNHLGILRPRAGAQPAQKAPECPPSAGSSESLPYSHFSEPVMAENQVHSQGIIVAGTVESDGKPGIAISYLVEGEWLPFCGHRPAG